MPLGGTLFTPRIFVSRAFRRWQRKTRLPDHALLTAITELRAGLVDADLGGGLFKKRVAWPGHGKRGGGRLLVATNRHDRWFLVIGFAKNERSDLSPNELVALQKWSGDLLAMDEIDLHMALAAGEIQELFHGNADQKTKPGTGRGA